MPSTGILNIYEEPHFLNHDVTDNLSNDTDNLSNDTEGGNGEMEVDPKKRLKVRVDSGVNEGSEISMFYDPMISKLVSYSSLNSTPSTSNNSSSNQARDDAIQIMERALNSYSIQVMIDI